MQCASSSAFDHIIPSCRESLYHRSGGCEASSDADLIAAARHFIMSCHSEQKVWHESSLALAFTLQSTCPGQPPNQNDGAPNLPGMYERCRSTHLL